MHLWFFLVILGFMACSHVVELETTRETRQRTEAALVASVDHLPPLTKARSDERRELSCVRQDWHKICVGDTERPDGQFGGPDMTYRGTDGTTIRAYDLVRGRVGCYVVSREKPYRIERLICEASRTWFEP